jgi:hypothetical protein
MKMSFAVLTALATTLVPVVRQLAERLELHRLRCGSPQSGPVFANVFGKPMALSSVGQRQIAPALNRCVRYGKQ